MNLQGVGILLVLLFATGAHAHGAVTKPYPRKLVQQTYCPWCVGEHLPENPPGQVNHDATPSSPCLGTARGDATYTTAEFGSKYSSIAGPGNETYSAGNVFQTNIVLDADHNGDARWSFCPHSKAETEDCFRSHPMTDWTDVHSYWNADNTDDHWKSGQHFPQDVSLPSDAPAGPATLRWLWVCKYTDEVFVSCIDVVIASGDGVPSPPTTLQPPLTTTPVPTSPPGPCQNLWGQCGGMGWTGATCCDPGSYCQEANPYYHQCIPGAAPTPAPTATTTPSLTSLATTPPPSGTCSCSRSSVWHGSFDQFADGTSFCAQSFGGANPYISAGGGAGSSGGWSGLEPCQSGQYQFSEHEGWKISVDKAHAQGRSPYRAFAYLQFCNGRPYGECWDGQDLVTFSFSFKTDGVAEIGAYVKLLFWTDSGNIIGLLPPSHPQGGGKFRLVAFPANDYPNAWSHEAVIQDKSWYNVRIDFAPASRGVSVFLDDVKLGDGTIPVNMLAASDGPQIGVYSFDYGPSWSHNGFKLWLDDVCVGEKSGTCPSGGSGPMPSTATATTTLPPTPVPPVSTTMTTRSPSTSSEPTCGLERDMRTCVALGGSFECERCTNDITGELCCSCQGEDNPVTTTETITTTTSSQAAGLCKSWCATNTKSWEKKCRWTKCAGCSPCSARRLRGSDIMFL